jgi:putative membrane protein
MGKVTDSLDPQTAEPAGSRAKVPLGAGLSLVVLFALSAFVQGNYEFLFYSAVLLVLLGVLYVLSRQFQLSALGLWGMNLWLLSHLAGGMGSIDGVRLYDVVLIPLTGAPYHLLKYDQLIHVYCYLVIGLLAFEVVSQLLSRASVLSASLCAVCVACGIGSLNEVLEFAAVVVVGSTGVGDYINNAIDLVANLLGAMMGVGFGLLRRKN